MWENIAFAARQEVRAGVYVARARVCVAKELFVLLFISAAAAASATDVSARSVTDSGDGGHAPVGRPTLRP